MPRFAMGLFLALVVSIAGACATGSPGPTSASPVKGGTLHIVNGDDVDFLDTADRNRILGQTQNLSFPTQVNQTPHSLTSTPSNHT